MAPTPWGTAELSEPKNLDTFEIGSVNESGLQSMGHELLAYIYYLV